MGISTTGRIWVINDEFDDESKDYEFHPEDNDKPDDYEESVKEGCKHNVIKWMENGAD